MRPYPIILGTAGHIDHGKTALVKALTGIDTDRLKEEKERGITIELGFAHLDVGEGANVQRFGLIDVPGHERFLKAMVAGSTGVDVVMLVVAADEGVMPQTREHLDICGLLGIKRGLVVLTKRDLVDEEWTAMVTAEVRQATAGTFLDGAPVIPVSALTGDGLPELRRELVRLAAAVPARSADSLFRLPLDRVFTMKGFGTVVTGTVIGGRVAVGDDVVVLPEGRTAKVRGLQVHGEVAKEARAGMRCAVNLVGLDRDEVQRGDLLAHPGTVDGGHLLDVRLRVVAACKAPLPRRSRALVHHTTAQVLAQVVLVDRDELAPGEEGLAQLHLDTPVAALPGDRVVLRGFVPQEHHGTTLGGGEVLRVHPPKVRRSSSEAAEALRRLADAEPVERVGLEILGGGPAGRTRAELAARLGLAPTAIDAALGRLVESGEICRADGDHYLHAEPLARLEAHALAAIDGHHAAQPTHDGIPREELRSRLPRGLPPRLFEALLAGLARRGAVVAERDTVRRARRVLAAERSSPEVDELVARLRAAGLETPRPADLPGGALDLAVRAGRVVRIRGDYVVERATLDELREKLRTYLRAHGQINAQEWKTLTGATRKYAIPLAEHFDAEKLTLRVGDLRKLRG